MPDPYYRVEVTAGPYSWVTTDSDPADYGLADPLTVQWSAPANGQKLPQPDPLTASFRVVVADMADLAGIAFGQPVTIRVYAWPPGTINPDLHPAGGICYYPPIVVFRGRIANLTAQPHKLGMILTVQATEYTVDLAERQVGSYDWPQESPTDRIERICSEAGINAMSIDYDYTPLAARSAGLDSALNQINRMTSYLIVNNTTVQYLASWYGEDPIDSLLDDPGPNGPIFRINILSTGSDGSTTIPRFPEAHFRQVHLPGTLEDLGAGLYGVVLSQPDGQIARIIDAGHVDFESAWRLSKSEQPDTLSVTGPFTDLGGVQSLTFTTPNPVGVKATIETDLVTSPGAVVVGEFNRPDAGDSDRWQADDFTFYADLDPTRLVYPRPLFADGLTLEVQKHPVVVAGIPSRHNPAGVDYFAGQVAGATFTLQHGRYTAGITVRRALPRLSPGDTGFEAYLSPADVDPAIAVADVDRSVSVFDARLLRKV